MLKYPYDAAALSWPVRRHRLASPLALGSLLALLALGCAERDLDWDVAFDPSSLEDDTMRLDARILRGDCPGTETLWDQSIHPTAPRDEPPSLAEGTYCLAAVAGNAACEWFAFGQQTVQLPTDEPVVVTVRGQAPEPNCATDRCSGGTCEPPVTTCGSDCTQTCDTDCAVTCDTGGCTQTCRGGALVDCSLGCAGGACTVICEDDADCVADCPGGGCDMHCRGIDSICDFTCAGGGCTFSCADPDNCTTSCSEGCTGP